MVVLSLGEDTAPGSSAEPVSVSRKAASRESSRKGTPRKTEASKEAKAEKAKEKIAKKAKSRHASVGARQRTPEEKDQGKESSESVSSPKKTETPPGGKVARAALLELSKAFQTGNETAAIQALGQLMRNRQGLENLSGFDEKTTRHLQQALNVMASEPAAESLFNSDAKLKDGITQGVPVLGLDKLELPGGGVTVQFPEEQRRLVASDWKRIQKRSKSLKMPGSGEFSRRKGATSKPTEHAKAEDKKLQQKSSFWKSSRGSKSHQGEVEESQEKDLKSGPSDPQKSAMDFTELLVMNTGIIGANMSYMKILLSSFEQLLAPVLNGQPGEAETAADVVALRFFREAQGEVQLKDFKTSMLASARALLPDTWDSNHENAWTAVWDCICVQLEKAMPLPRRYVAPVQGFVAGFSKEQRMQLAVKTFDRLFRETPEVSKYFKTSNMRLAFIVGKALDFASRLFDEPALMVDEMTALGLKHVFFQAQSQFFHSWVSALVAEIQEICTDEEVVQGMNYAMCVIGSLIGQAVESGSTPVAQAVVKDDVKALKKALQATARAERFEAMLGRSST